MNKGIFKFRVFRRRRTACRIVAAFSAFAMLCVASLPAFAAPTAVLDNDLGGAAFNYIKGATHNQIDADHATFTASGQGGLIDWQALNVGSGQGLNFQGNQFFNVVSGGDRSQIAGTLEASGALWIFNPAGVSFLSGANVTAGGLFAVATANLANKSEIEAAIEAGSAIPTPVIGGWGTGKISSEQGAEFSADVVTMLGRSIDLAGGDFSKVGSLSVGGGGKTVVDEVGGGKVSINLGDFLDDADVDGISVELGDINLGDKDNPTGKQGDLTVATEGSILVKGAVKAEGDIVFKSLAGEGASAPVISYKKMSVASGKLLQGKSVSATVAGRVTVDGVVEATGDEAGVEIESGLYTGINGSVKAVKNVTVTAQGNINVAGTVESSEGAVTLAAEGADKSVKVGWNGNAASANALVSGANGVSMKGKISSQILAGEVTAAAGDVSLSGGEYVAVAGKATAESGDVNLSTTESATLSDNVGGTSFKAGDTAGVIVLGEGQIKAGGDVVVESVGAFQTTDGTSVEVGDSGTLSVNAAEGTDIGGDFTTANMTIAGNEADVTISKEIDITGDLVIDNAANISVESGISANDITFKGTKTTVAGDIAGNDLAVKTADGTANADLKQTAGVIDVNSITAANIEQTGGTMTAADYIKADGEIKQNGDNATTVMTAKTVEAATVSQSGGKIVASEKVKADVTQAGCEIDTPEIDGNLTQTDASDVATVGKVTGNVVQSAGTITAKGNSLIVSGTTQQTGGTLGDDNDTVTLTGALTQTADGTITADTLNLEADSSVAGKVEAATLDAEGTALTASGEIDATTVKADTLNVTDGTVDATDITATTLDVDGGTVAADTIAADVDQDGGKVTATTSITGDVDVDGAASTLETAKIDGALTQENGTVAADEVTGAAKVNGGTLTASKLGSLEQTAGEVVAKGDALTVSGTTQQSGGTLGDDNDTIMLNGALTQSGGTIAASELSLSGGAEQTDPNGTVNADTLVLADSDFNVTLDKGANKIGSVYGRVKNIALKDTDGGLVIGNDMNNLGAEGNVSIETVGDMTEFGGDYGKIVARNGKTTVTSTDGNINLDHGWNMFSEVEATAEKGSVNIVNAIGYDPSNPAAVQNLKVDGATAKNDVRIISKDTVTIAGAVDATEGNIRLESTKATLNVDAVVSGNNVTLAAANGITENAAVNAAADKYVKSANGDINVNATATVGGDVAYVANKTTGKIVTGDGATIGSTGGGTTYKSDSTGTIAANGSMTSKDGVTTFKDASVVAIDTTDSVVVNNDGVAVTVGEVAGGVSVTEVLADPSGGPAADGTETVALDSSSASGITAKDVTITVAGDPGDVAVSVEKAISVTDGSVSIETEKGDVNIQADVVATGGDVIADAGDSIMVDSTGAISGKSVALTANGTGDGKGIQIAGGVSATDGTLDITATGADGISLTGTVTADSGATTLTAANGAISAANADNDFQSLTATAKSVTLNDKDDITLTEVVSKDGDVRVKATTGNLTVADATTDKVTAPGDIRLEAADGAITVGAGVKGNNVTVSANGNVTTKKEDGVSNGTLSANNGGDLLVESTDGNIVLAADASAADTAALFSEKGSINAAKIDAPTAYAKGKGDVTIGDVTGALVMTTEGNIDVEFKDDADHTIAYNAGGYVNVKAKGGLVVDSATPEGADLKVTEVLWPEDTADRTLVDHNVADTQVSGVTAGKEAALESTASSIEVRTGMDAGTTASLNAKTDVTVLGTVSGKTGVTVDAGGDVTVDGAVVKAGEFADETTGAVKSGSNANLTIAAGNGVTVLKGATVAATGTAGITASGAKGVTVKGTDTKIVADKSLAVQTTTGDGSVAVSEGAYVAARNSVDGNMVTISSEKGSVTVSGAATAVEAGKDLTLTAKTGVMVDAAKAGSDKTLKLEATGDESSVNVNGGAKVLAAEDIDIDAKGAVLVDNATVAAKGDVLVGDATTRAGSFTAQNGATVTADGSVAAYVSGNATVAKGTGTRTEVSGKTGVILDATGAVEVNGAVVKAGVIDETTGEVSGEAANLAVAAGGAVTVDGGAKVGSSGATAIDAASGVTVKGASYVGANTTLDVGTTDGKATASLAVQDSAQLVARDNLTAKTSGNIDINSSAKVASDKTLKLEATGDESSVNVNGGAKVLAEEDIDIDAKGAVLVDNATVAAKGDVLVGDATTRAGSFTAQNGATVTADGSVAAYVSGNATVAKGTGTRTEVSGKTGVILDATGAVEVNGAVVKAGVIDETTGEVSGEAANLAVAAGGAVTVDGGAKVGSSGATAIDAASGVTVKGASYVGANTTLDVGTTDGKATASLTVQDSAQLVARDNLTAKTSGNIDINSSAKVASDKTLKLEATGDESSVNVNGGAKVLAAEDIDIDAKGAVLVDNATVAAKGDVLVGDATTRAGSFTAQNGATVVADAGSVSVYAKGDATVDGGTTSVTANNGDVTIDANGNIEVKGATVTATGGDAILTAGKDDSTDNGRIDISGTVVATSTDDQDSKGGNVTLTAKGADVADDPAKSAIEITGTVTADQKTAINATVGGVDVKGGTVVANGKDDANVGVAINAGTTLTISGDGTVKAAKGAVETTAQNDVTVTDTAVVEAGAAVKVESKAVGDITVDTKKGVAANGGNVTIDNKNGSVSVRNATVEAKGDNGSVDIDAKGNVVIEKGTQNAVVKSDKKDVLIETTDGNISIKDATVTSGNNLRLGNSSTTDGKGNVTIDTGVTLVAGQNATIEAQRTVEIKSDVTAAAGTIDVEATNGSIVMANETTVKTTDQNIRLRSKGGITMEKIDAKGESVAKGGSVTLDTDGDLVMASDNAGVTADGLAVNANAVGTANNKMKFSVSKLAVDSAKDVYVDNDKSVTVTSAGGDGDAFKVVRVKPDGSKGSAHSSEIDGVVANGGDVDLDVVGENSNLTVDSGSSISSTGNTDVHADGTIAVNGRIEGVTTSVDAGKGLDINGQISGAKTLINAGGDLTVNGDVSGASLLKAGGNVNVNGTVGGGDVTVEAGGGIAFDADGSVSGSDVTLTAESGDITQQNATVAATGGYVEEGKSAVNAAVNASGTATLTAANGSIGTVGSGTADYVGVEGSVIAKAGGDVAVADAVGDGLVVGEGGIEGGEAAAVLTAGSISGDGTIKAPNVTVSAKSFDDDKVPVKVSAGNSLTVNNFRSGMSPLLAVFESDGGNARPRLSNLPNKTVVFFDGRLLGGDIKTINTVGAVEAFPVQTPELKSEQGIFGNPTFLHNELDVSNPMAVGAIDFILLEIPRLTLSDDFPLEVERHVAAAGLNPTTTYWFGQSNEEAKDEAEGNDGSEPPASGEKPDEKGDEGTTPVHTAKN